MKTLALSVLSISLAFSAPALSQGSEPIDEIISRGTNQKDPAMSAWHAGDFAKAEIEFDRNAFCALRAERNFISGVETARDSSITSDLAADAVSTPQPVGGLGGASVVESAPPPIPQYNSSSFKNKESATKRTCEDRGFQLYMKGLSQLKLGKIVEAKKTLSRAANMRKNLYDAHFRLSLLEYQDGNLKGAAKHLKKLKKLKSSYKFGEANKEIEAQIAYLSRLLD
ncbi:hypothetical protein [Hellea balneolensis]|uniref:hypothetical protein n=1 Tax=Hellea balneolensis TaxID=287478 RepID=UPI0004263475|nr:hypothetical protein [Hellea balneolensis]